VGGGGGKGAGGGPRTEEPGQLEKEVGEGRSERGGVDEENEKKQCFKETLEIARLAGPETMKGVHRGPR